MLGDARQAQELAQALDERGLFVAGFFFPVVPKGQARIRTQMSAALTEADVDFAIAAFADAGRALGIVEGRSQERGGPPPSLGLTAAPAIR